MSIQPFDWKTYFQLAQELGARTEEACLRSCISRAYYYVYNIALIRAKKNLFNTIQGESTHAQLWRIYSASPDPECSRLGQIALRLKEKRQRADYEGIYRRIEEEVPAVLREAQDFAARLERLESRFPNPSSVRW